MTYDELVYFKKSLGQNNIGCYYENLPEGRFCNKPLVGVRILSTFIVCILHQHRPDEVLFELTEKDLFTLKCL